MIELCIFGNWKFVVIISNIFFLSNPYLHSLVLIFGSTLLHYASLLRAHLFVAFFSYAPVDLYISERINLKIIFINKVFQYSWSSKYSYIYSKLAWICCFLLENLPINIKWNQFYKWVIVLRNVPDQILSLNLYPIHYLEGSQS